MKYPQSLFTEKIKAHIHSDAGVIIDAPCGNGQTTYELAQFFSRAQVIGVDIDAKSILNARTNFQLSNNEFKKGDIHDFIENSNEFDVFCLINSLFLLAQPEQLLKKISKKLSKKGQLFLVLPNPQSTNFKRYQKLFPEVNSFILEKEDYDTFFKKVGLKIIFCKGIARVPIYGRWDTKFLYPIRDRYLFYLENRSQSEDYGYYLLEMKNLS